MTLLSVRSVKTAGNSKTVEDLATELIFFIAGEAENEEEIDKSFDAPGLGSKVIKLKRALEERLGEEIFLGA
jgi:hypothetical protein